MATSTDAMYNAESRYLHQMFKIHFSASIILEVTKSNYLMSSSILEESYKSSDSPFGEITSNELSLTLYNDNGMFNPINTSGPYYRLIRKGVKVEAFIRPDEVDEWDKIGEFYVTDWYATSGGVTAEVTLNDKLYSVLNGSAPTLPVYRSISFADFITLYFNQFGYSITVDETIDYIIPYAYTSSHSNNKQFLSDLLKSAMADCFCNHNGDITIISKIKGRPIRATFTDSDQIMNVAIKQTLTASYDSVTVACNRGQESAEQSLVKLSDIAIEPGYTETGKITLSTNPALCIRQVNTSGSESVKVASFSATANEFTATLQSTASTSTELNVVGTALEIVQTKIGEANESPLDIDSRFIQDEQRAEDILQYANAFVSASMPTVDLTVRGNPRIELGSLIEIDSTRFKTNYVGILVKASYEYTGSLTCNMILVDASEIEVV